MRIGKKELELLIIMASPVNAWRAEGDPISRVLIHRGLMHEPSPGIARITPEGLRALADAMDDGLLGDALDRMIADIIARMAATPPKDTGTEA
jgi:hypothetical protein